MIQAAVRQFNIAVFLRLDELVMLVELILGVILVLLLMNIGLFCLCLIRTGLNILLYYADRAVKFMAGYDGAIIGFFTGCFDFTFFMPRIFIFVSAFFTMFFYTLYSFGLPIFQIEAVTANQILTNNYMTVVIYPVVTTDAQITTNDDFPWISFGDFLFVNFSLEILPVYIFG